MTLVVCMTILVVTVAAIAIQKVARWLTDWWVDRLN